MTVGAIHHVRNGEFPVGTPFAAPCPRVPSLGKWHQSILSFPGSFILKISETFPSFIYYLLITIAIMEVAVNTALGT